MAKTQLPAFTGVQIPKVDLMGLANYLPMLGIQPETTENSASFELPAELVNMLLQMIVQQVPAEALQSTGLSDADRKAVLGEEEAEALPNMPQDQDLPAEGDQPMSVETDVLPPEAPQEEAPQAEAAGPLQALKERIKSGAGRKEVSEILDQTFSWTDSYFGSRYRGYSTNV